MTESGEMDNSFWICPLNGLLQPILCEEIHLEKLDLFELWRGLDIGSRHLVPLVPQIARQTAADEPGDTSDEDFHGVQVAAVSTVRPRRWRQ